MNFGKAVDICDCQLHSHQFLLYKPFMPKYKKYQKINKTTKQFKIYRTELDWKRKGAFT